MTVMPTINPSLWFNDNAEEAMNSIRAGRWPIRPGRLDAVVDRQRLVEAAPCTLYSSRRVRRRGQ